MNLIPFDCLLKCEVAWMFSCSCVGQSGEENADEGCLSSRLCFLLLLFCNEMRLDVELMMKGDCFYTAVISL